MLRLALAFVALTANACSVNQSATVPGDGSVDIDTGPDVGSPGDSGDARPRDSVADAPGDSGSVDSGPGCAPNETMCGDECLDVETNPLHCGGCDRPCAPAPANASTTCSGGRCGTTCDEGWAPDGAGGCVENVCGDGHLDVSEECDDSNIVINDGCSWAGCALENRVGACSADALTMNRAKQSYRGHLARTDTSGLACEGTGPESAFIVTVNFPGNLTISLHPTGFDAVLTVYDSTTGCPGRGVACAEGGGEGASQTVTLSSVRTGERYLVVVSSTHDLGEADAVDFVLELTGF